MDVDFIAEDITDALDTEDAPNKYIYISGPMTKPGYKLSQKIAKTVSRINGLLVDTGWSVYNPWGSVLAEDNWDNVCHGDWLNSDLAMLNLFALAGAVGLADETAILMLSFNDKGEVDYTGPHSWEDSAGATTEYEFSQALGYPLQPYLWAEDAESYELIPLNGGDA